MIPITQKINFIVVFIGHTNEVIVKFIKYT